MKRKAQTGGRAEPLNLKRFRSELNQFSKEHSADWLHLQQAGGKREIIKPSIGLNRKQRRKEERKLKKMRKFAFKQKKPLPTKEQLDAEKKAAAKAEKLKRVKEKRKQQKMKKKTKLKEKQAKSIDVRKQGLIEANKAEERAIKQLEKQLKMNRRKSKSLPTSFKNDGLDYILGAVDGEELKNVSAVYDGFGDEDDDGDEAPKSSWDVGEEEYIDDDDDGNGGTDKDDDSDDDGDGVGMRSEEDSDEDESYTSDELRSGEDIQKDPGKRLQSGSSSSSKSGILKVVSQSEKHSKSVHFSEGLPECKGVMVTKKVKVKTVGEPGSSGSKLKAKKSLKVKDKQQKKVAQKVRGEEEEDSDWSDGITDSDTDDGEDDHAEVGKTVKEDIYGRVIGDNEVSKAYIPPAKRNQPTVSGADAKKQLELTRLKKQLKGLLNRLSEATLQSISHQIEDLYCQNSRMEMTECLAELVMASCVSSVLIPERLVMEHAMLLAILHCNVATDIGAYFIQLLARRFDSELQRSDYGETKEVDNVLTLLANLYNFKVVHSLLLFDVLKKLTENFREKDIELLLLVLKNVGFSLRKDDPVTLKELILKIQQKAANVDISQFKEKSRVKFMTDVLLAIKNNNMRKIPNYDRTHLDHLLKVIRNYVRGGSIAEHQLRISLSDLLEADQRGRWWVVGSAWTGSDLESSRREIHGKPAEGEVSSHILELARQQRMNTDVRKTIFCIIMTCEDFVDAFEKLLQLDLKNQQECEIIHIIMDLCLQEKDFNPFYAFLTQKFCEHDRRFQMTTQFTLWDKFKELQQYSERKLNNLAAYLTHLLAHKAQSLSVFKVLEFAELDKPRVSFLKRVLTSLLLDQPEHVISDVFIRIATSPKLRMLREGLKLFMRHFLLRGSKKLDPDVRATLEERVNLAEKMLTAGEARLML